MPEPVERQGDVAHDKFAGRAIVISPDRRFLDRIAAHILAFAGDSMVTFHA